MHTVGINPKADFYFSDGKKWQAKLLQLRSVILDCGLIEELKWGVPCYTLATGAPDKKSRTRNIVLIHVFKHYCAMLFFRGALLSDPAGILVQQTGNTQSARQARFTNVHEVVNLSATLKAYIYEAIELDKAGVKVHLKDTDEFPVPEEFKTKLEKVPGLRTAFGALTPGRQRAYLLHFAAPKQSATRSSRIEKCLQQIFNGMGLNDR